jgi:hypothetical protein
MLVRVCIWAAASGFQSIYGFLFGWVELNIKLPSGNSSGTVTAYYVRPESILLYIHHH